MPALGFTQLELAPESLDALRGYFERELRHRRVFIPGFFAFEESQSCLFVLVHPTGGRFEIEAKVVYAKREEPFAGVGLELVGLDRARSAELLVFVDAHDQTPTLHEACPTGTASGLPEHPDAPSTGGSQAQRPKTLYDRIRELSVRERELMARDGNLSERVALERTFGGSVWEALLQNPQLTQPEVAHIAKNGTLPAPLVAMIVANSSWLNGGEVRRALLSNPRLNGSHLDRVLKAMPRAELKQLSQTSSSRQQVRIAAKKVLGE